MNCYDFDKTVYKKDSSIKFFIFCLKKRPVLFFHLIKCCFMALFHALGFIKTKAFKETFFKFLNKFDNIDKLVEDFWQKEIKNINSWYMEQKKENDVICSASPDFLVRPALNLINPNCIVICTKMNPLSGKIDGENLKGQCKVDVIKKYFKNDSIEFECAYTDSESDLPMLDLAKKQYIVGKRNKVYLYGKQKVSFSNKIKYIIKQLRPKHYIKNGLIFLPLFFSGALNDATKVMYTISGFISFCLMASFVYVVNDLFDAKNDRKHSSKRKRPIACYMLKQYEAIIMAIILATSSVLLNILTFGINAWLICLIIGYAVINLAYSFSLKNVAIVDVFILAGCYLIRILFGGLLINVAVSKWLYLTILCGALFMGFGKRRNEMVNEKTSTRKVNKFYNYQFLDKNMHICLAMCLVFYSLWATNILTLLTSFNKFLLLVTIPLVYFIMMKYSLDVEQNQNSGDPIDVLLRDFALIISVLIFIALILVVFYFPINISFF